jgi:hypothetical protein
MNVRCFFKGHDWTPWQHWSRDRPRIVRASLEYLNDTTNVHTCKRCGRYVTERPRWRAGRGDVMSDGAPADRGW